MHRSRTVWALTLVAIMPFAGATWALWAVGGPYAGPALLALMAWAAAMLAFLGGVRWGATAASPAPDGLMLAAAWLPAFAGWGLLAAPITDVRLQIGGFIAAFAAVLLWELRAAGPGGAPRLALIAGALIALIAALVFVIRL